MKRIISGVAVLGLGLLPIGPTTSSVSAQPAPERTEFAFAGSGYATNVSGGIIPVDSGKTALSVLGCTNQAPVKTGNRVAEADLAPLPVEATVLRTSTQSQAVPGGFASVSTSLSDVQVGNAPAALIIAGLRTTAKAAFVNGDAQATVDFSVATATLGGVAIPLQSLQNGVDVLGVGSVQLGWERTIEKRSFAFARGRGLRIVVTALGDPPTVVTVGEVSARIDRRPFGGIFSGGATVGKATALNGNVRSGPLVSQPHKCAGTNGQWLTQNAAAGDLDGLAQLTAAQARVRTDDFDDFSTSKSEASVADATIAGEIEVEGLVVKAYTRRTNTGAIKRSANGTTLARLRIGGEEVEIPNPGETIDVPGVAEVTFQKVRRTPNGIDVTGLRIELLEGDGAVIEVARAVAKID